MRKNISVYTLLGTWVKEEYFPLIQDVSKYFRLIQNISRKLLGKFFKYIMNVLCMKGWKVFAQDEFHDDGNNVGDDASSNVSNVNYDLDCDVGNDDEDVICDILMFIGNACIPIICYCVLLIGDVLVPFLRSILEINDWKMSRMVSSIRFCQVFAKFYHVF